MQTTTMTTMTVGILILTYLP